MKKTVTVFGGYGGVNLGDECILFSLVKMIKIYHPKIKNVNIISRHVECIDIRDCDLNLNYIQKNNIAGIVKSSLFSNLIVGGGQLLNGSASSKGLLFILLLIILFKLLNKKVYIVGVGCGEFSTPVSRQILKLIVRLSDEVLIRDQSSIKKIKAVTDSDKIRTIPDFVYCQKIKEIIKSKSETVYPNNKKKNNIIFVISGSPEDSWNKLETYKNLLKIISRNFKDKNIICIPHDLRKEYDAGLLKKIIESLNCERLQNVNYLEHIELYSLIELYNSAELVVSARMHPLIIGSIMGCKIVGIKNSTKVEDLSTEFGFPLITESNKMSEIENLIKAEVFKDYSAIRNIIYDKNNELVIGFKEIKI